MRSIRSVVKKRPTKVLAVNLQLRAFQIESKAPLKAVALFKQAFGLNLKQKEYGLAEGNLLEMAQILEKVPNRKAETRVLRRRAGFLDLRGFCEQITEKGANLNLLKSPWFGSYYSFVSKEKGTYLRTLFKGENPYKPWKLMEFINFLKKEEPSVYKEFGKRIEALQLQLAK